ncbi:MAG: UpxY family transcription antiterminator [Bacteroidetes bacterium]|uniref:UpxY family transcription antiterminator n=1 Tax=Candidatus Cryptobacteroides intestinigallinarum TaxID=2840767 RepID=A0A9D9N012_9BACT|nr:UpxY family transcription antiterminator [Candidatus Cryptobacteroides intestinigallinarum]
MASNVKDDNPVWFAMRVTYRREMKVKDKLDDEGLEYYIPMHYTFTIRRGRKVKELVPVVRGLIFVHAPQSDVQRVKEKMPYLQYIVNRRLGTKIIVPEDQMRLFIAVTGTCDEKLIWFNEDEVNIKAGTRVRIIAGDFEGYEGIFMKVKGARDRRVVIAVEGVIAVALATISPELIEVIS